MPNPTPPILLAIESATDSLSVAVLRGEAVLAELGGEGAQRHAETILGCIDSVLAQAGVGLDGVEAFAVSIGPGSFTSLRIGLATVKGLALGTARPVAAVSTLEALAVEGMASQRRPEQVVVPLLDARRGEVYAGGWRRCEGGVESVVGESVYTPGELAAVLPACCVLVGEGAPLFGAEIAGQAAGEVEVGPALVPRAATVGRLGARLLADGGGVEARALAPRYLRRAQAEALRSGEALEP